MRNNTPHDHNSESAMINAALELLTSQPPTSNKSKEASPDMINFTSSEPTNRSHLLNAIATEVPLDWRLEVSQTERFQVIQKLSQQIFQSLPPDQKNETRISQIAQKIEKRFFDISKSKMEYFTNLKAQIFEIQKKCNYFRVSAKLFFLKIISRHLKNLYIAFAKNSKQQSQVIMAGSPTNAGSVGPQSAPGTSPDGDVAASNTASDKKTMDGNSQDRTLPIILQLSEVDKKIVQEKLGQISHFFPKINGLVNTISTLGTKADVLQIHKLINIKKAIYYQLEGLKVDRYTISVEAANSLQATMARYFQYGAMLIKQNQERSSQLHHLMESKDAKKHGQIFTSPSPQSQPNITALGASALNVSPNQSVMGNQTPTPILPRSTSNTSMKLNAQIKQQLFIQKINQKNAQDRLNTKVRQTFSQQDLDLLLSEGTLAALQKNTPNGADPLPIKEDDFSEYFNFDEDQSPIESPNSIDSSSRKRKSISSESESFFSDISTKKIKTSDQDSIEGVETSPSVGKPLTLLQELQYLEKEFNISFETIELDDIEGEQLHLRSNETPIQSPTVKMGKVLVFCYLSQSPLRIAFRLSSKAEYEQAILDRKHREKIVHASFFEKFRSYGIGLEDVEVLSDQDLDNYESIIKITSFSTELGVGISGNMVQISDILRYTFNDVLKNNN